MKNYYLLFTVLILIGCTKEEIDTEFNIEVSTDPNVRITPIKIDHQYAPQIILG